MIDFNELYYKMLKIAYKNNRNPKKFYKILHYIHDKAVEYDLKIKDESEFFNGDSEISPNQYDFEYRQNWAIEESGKAYNTY